MIGSVSDRPEFHLRQIYRPASSATTEPDPKDPTKTVAVPYAATIRAVQTSDRPTGVLIDRVKVDAAKLAKENPSDADPGRSGDHLGQRSRPRHHSGRRAVPGAARWPRRAISIPTSCARSSPSKPTTGFFGILGEKRVNVLAPQPRARPTALTGRQA